MRVKKTVKNGKLKIGIPRALFYFHYFHFWKTFFEKLGLDVVTSLPTDREILNEGISRLTSEICLPVKAFCGHVASLKGKCDFIFIPSFFNLEAFENPGTGFQGCPKHIGLPDLVKAVFPEIPPNSILDPDIDFSKGKAKFYASLFKIGSLFHSNPLKIKEAIKEALKSQREFREKKLKKLKKDNKKIKIGLLGHRYLLEDEYLNHHAIFYLQKMGVEILFPSMLNDAKLSLLLSSFKIPYWSCEAEIIGGSLYFMEKEKVDGLILLSTFGCGPSSVIIDLLEKHAGDFQTPFLHLVLDEHTSEVGLVTRLEAFVDTIAQNKRKKEALPEILQKGLLVGKERILRLGLPYLGGRPRILRKIFKENFGISLILPPVTERTIEIGAKYAPTEICFPFKVMLGTFIECLEAGADTLGTIGNLNACRNKYYDKLHEEILKSLPYKFRFFKADTKDKGIFGILKTVRRLTGNAPFSKILFTLRLGIQKLKVLDLIEREVQKIRAKELKKGKADQIFKEAIRSIDEALTFLDLKKVKEEYLKKLSEVPQDIFLNPPKIGIVGEFYVVIEDFVNMEVEKELGKLGAITERLPSTYLSEYTNFFRGDPLTREKRRLKPHTFKYLKREVGGHALESLGTKVEGIEKYDGIVHLMPFGCLPESIAQNIMLATKEKIPVLTIYCDEKLAKAGVVTRLEAFFDQVKNYQKNKKL